MDYELIVQDDSKNLEVDVVSEREFTATIGEDKITATATPISSNLILLKIDGKPAKRVYFARNEKGTWLWIDGKARLVQDAQTLTTRRSSSGGHGQQALEITPPMPATVIKILVEEKDEVAKGAPVVVVSAMKMETTLTAPFDGVVTSINTKVGDNVSPGDILVDIEAAETEKEGDDE